MTRRLPTSSSVGLCWNQLWNQRVAPGRSSGCPGGIATPIFGKAFGLPPDRADATVPLMKSVLETLQPIRRAGLPEDIARTALWRASDESSFVNGHALVVDGSLIGGRLWSETEQRRAMVRHALGLTTG